MKVEIDETDELFKIVFKDDKPAKPIAVETKVEPDADKTIFLGLTKEGEIQLKEITFPKDSIYSRHNIQETASKIQQRFDAEGCKPCIALSEVEKTKKTFAIPFLTVLKDLIDA
jgi:hypothetical protein